MTHSRTCPVRETLNSTTKAVYASFLEAAERFSGSIKVTRLGVMEIPVQQASVEEQDMLCGMDCESIKRAISIAMEEIR